MTEPDRAIDAWAHAVIGAAIEVHRDVGPGYQESVYEEALAVEFGIRQIPFVRQHLVEVRYKGIIVGEGRLDFLVGQRLVVELKAVDALHNVHRAQVLSYLKALGTPLGLLLNFKCSLLKDGIERIVRTTDQGLGPLPLGVLGVLAVPSVAGLPLADSGSLCPDPTAPHGQRGGSG